MSESEKSDAPPPPSRAKWVLLGCVIVAIVAAMIGGIALLSVQRLKQRELSRQRWRCSNNVRQIGLAAIQYCDDKRFFPHLAKITELDNGGSTTPAGSDVSPRYARALMYFNYLDDPSVFCCPASTDAPAAPTISNAKTWGFGGEVESGVDPMIARGNNDTDGDKLTDLSYGFTIKAYTASSRSDRLLVADRARKGTPVAPSLATQKIAGNHDDGWFIVFLDGHTSYLRSPDARQRLSGTSGPEDGFLSIWDDLNNGLDPLR